MENGTSARKNAHANVPSAKFTPPSRISGHASSAPSAAAASAAITTAQKKFSWPWETSPGMFDAEVVGERPAPGEPAGGHEAGLHEADLAAHAGDDDERQEDDRHHQALRDDGLVVRVGAEPVPPEPPHRERQQDDGPDGPREPAPQLRQAVAVVGRRDVVGHRSRASRSVAPDEQQQHDHEQVRHRRPEPAEVAEELRAGCRRCSPRRGSGSRRGAARPRTRSGSTADRRARPRRASPARRG